MICLRSLGPPLFDRGQVGLLMDGLAMTVSKCRLVLLPQEGGVDAGRQPLQMEAIINLLCLLHAWTSCLGLSTQLGTALSSRDREGQNFAPTSPPPPEGFRIRWITGR